MIYAYSTWANHIQQEQRTTFNTQEMVTNYCTGFPQSFMGVFNDIKTKEKFILKKKTCHMYICLLFFLLICYQGFVIQEANVGMWISNKKWFYVC